MTRQCCENEPLYLRQSKELLMNGQNVEKQEAPMSLPILHKDMTEDDIKDIMSSADNASTFLKAISHPGRLMLLCHLASGEKSVTELEELMSARQAAVSQQLARLRSEGLVTPRREGLVIYYSLTDARAIQILDLVYDLFCKDR